MNKILFVISFVVGVTIITVYLQVSAKNQGIGKFSDNSDIGQTFSVAQAPRDSIKGTITTMSGLVKWESRTATEPSELKNFVPIQQGEKLVTEKDGKATVEFPDIGMLSVSEDSEITFSQTLPVDFVIDQKKGIVSYNAEGKTPISVRSRNLLATIPQGIMIISLKDDDSELIIQSKIGTISIGYNNKEYITQTIKIQDGEQFVYDSDERTGKIYKE